MKNKDISERKLEYLKKIYPKGTRVELVYMNDPYTKLTPGLKGTVQFIDDMGTIFIKWDNGSGLGVVYGVDSIRIIGK